MLSVKDIEENDVFKLLFINYLLFGKGNFIFLLRSGYILIKRLFLVL